MADLANPVDPSQGKKRNRKADEKIITESLKRFHLSEESEADIRREALEADNFALGNQWDNGIQTGRELDGRPCLTINKTAPAIRQVTNDTRQNRPQAHVSPTDDETVEEAKILEGMIRHIQVNSNSDVAVDIANDQQVRGGWGYFRVLTEYISDDSFDQEIKIKPIKDRFTVFDDPFCLEPDYSDRRWCHVINDQPKDLFEQENPDASVASSFSADDLTKRWIAEDTVRVAEYWVVEENETELYELANGSTMLAEDYKKATEHAEQAPHILPPPQIKRRRTVKQRKVKCYKMTAFEILDEYEWAGKYIPIIPVLGEDHEVAGKRYLRGLTYGMMDPQRQYNYWSSAATEAIALAPKAPWLVAEGQTEGYEQQWQYANRGSPSMLVYKPTSLNGQPLAPPSRIQAEPPIQAMAMAIRQASDNMKEVSGIYSDTLGQHSASDSGRAILARQHQGDTANFHFADNLSRSLRFLGVMLLNLIPKIYDTNRIVRIVHEDGTHEAVEVNQHLKAGQQPQAQDGAAKAQKALDITTGRYDIVMDTGPSYNTKRQETAQSMLQVSQAYPPLWDKAGDLLVKNMDWPGAQDLADRLKKFLPPQAQDEADGETPLPPQVQQTMQQMKMVIDQQTQVIHKMHDEREAKTLELESRERIATENNATALAIAELKTTMDSNFKLFQEELLHMRETRAHVAQVHQAEQSAAQAQQAAAQQEAQPGMVE